MNIAEMKALGMNAAQIAAMQGALDKAKAEAANQPRKITFKVGEKGGVSLYGLNRQFPVTLYRSQWERLIDAVPALQAFIVANVDKLATKPAKE